ncbi:MAG: hypothetical protein PHP03_00845 [Candidatus Pacebacteria bacterium]|nr:hypothetical protein [Candidatus Paceibacterota bacterium]
MIRIEKENVPCFYDLSWQPKPPAIILKIHKDLASEIKPIPNDAPFVIGYRAEFGFTSFIGSFNENLFGFNGALQKQKPDGGEFINFLVWIPKLQWFTGNICPVCNGKGKDTELELGCIKCGGTGKEKKSDRDWINARAISASLKLFFMVASMVTYEEKWRNTACKNSQLLELTLATGREFYGGQILGKIGKPFHKFLSSMGKKELDELNATTFAAYSQLFESISNHDRFFFRSHNYNGHLHFDCPGNACGLDFEEEEFSGHNTDTPAQQITLLAGLAKLCDMARETGI